MLADMHVKVETIKLLVYRAAHSVATEHRDAPMHCAVAKLYANEAGFEVVDRALQIHGGYGYSSEFPLERMLRDIRGLQIAGGSTQTLRNTIAAGILERRIDQRA
jgi:alkylation response protein AidB-like acyl-CoA dehydrogenase